MGNKTVLFFLLILFVLSQGFGDTNSSTGISVGEVIRYALDVDPQIKVARYQLEGAHYQYQSYLSTLAPQVTLEGSPVYSFRTETNETNSHAVSGGLRVSWLLPTNGTLSLQAGHTMAAVDTNGNTTINHNPSIGLSFSQPVFAPGALFGTELYTAGKNNQESRYKQAYSSHVDGVNRIVFQTLSNLGELISARKNRDLTDMTIAILEKKLENSTLQYEQGMATNRDVWDIDLALRKERDSRLQNIYALRQIEHKLEESTGLSGIENLVFQTLLPEIILPGEDELLAKGLASNVEILNHKEGLIQAENRVLLNQSEIAPNLTVSLNVAPQNPGETNSWNRISGSLGLSVPLYSGGKAENILKLGDAEIKQARAALEKTEKNLVHRIEALMIRREHLETTFEFYRENLLYDQKKYEDTSRLLEIKRATPIDVAEAERDLKMSELNVWKAETWLFLNKIELLILCGENIVEYLGL